MGYTIGEMAKKLNLAPSTLRYYDKEGLLPFVERTEGGIRKFKEEDYELLKIIGCLKATGMQLKDIKSFVEMIQLGDESIDDRLELFQKQRESVEKQLEALQTTLDVVNYKCWYLEMAKKMGTTSILNEMRDDEFPKEIQAIREKLKTKL